MKNQGLGKRSPVHLSLGRENYEALVGRHGQWVRWLQASRCICMLKNGRPDIQCTLCGGEGWQYRFQHSVEETLSLSVLDGAIVELPTGYGDAAVAGVHDYMGLSYSESGRYGSFVRLSGARTPAHGERLDLTVVRPVVKTLDQTSAVYVGAGCFVVGGLGVVGAAGVASDKTTTADIVSIVALRNETTGVVYPVLATRRNFAFASVAVDPAPGDVVSVSGVTYAEPSHFVVTGQQHREPDVRFLESIGGDASMSFPECYKVGEGDIVTLLAATQTAKRTISRGSGDLDTLPDFYVDSLTSLTAASGTYAIGSDFVLWGSNRIRWLGLNRPAAGANVSVVYEFNPTYRVLKEFPNVRSSENQNLPRRVALKLLSTYAERKAI